MGWSRGLKLKLLLILLIGSAALAASVLVSFRIEEAQSHTMNKLIFERIPLAIMIGNTTTHLSEVMRYSSAADLEDGDLALRTKSIELAEGAFNSFVTELDQLKHTQLQQKNGETLNELIRHSATVKPLFHKMIGKLKEKTVQSDSEARVILTGEISKESNLMTELLTEFTKSYEEQNIAFNTASQAAGEESTRNMQLVSILSILFLWSFGLTLAFSLSKKLQLLTSRVEDSSDEVANSSQKLASSSQQLSSAAQEQASALEESAASLQEITGMVESNLKNTEDSVKLANSVISLMAQTADTIRALTESMDEIKSSNARVEALAKLIEEIGDKTDLIDEIVFQTKLLSFNASVEAERAGEHGRGFAVVAQEVGNLAQMSGKSAIEIVAIVKSAIRAAQEVSVATKKSVETGHALCKETGMKMFEVATSAQKILESSEQINRASKEQNSGLRQISISVESLNQATQSNASNAEDSAASSAVLFELSQSLKSEVAELFEIVDGNQAEQHRVQPAKSAKVVSFKAAAPPLKKESSPLPVKKASGDSTPGNGGSDWDSL